MIAARFSGTDDRLNSSSAKRSQTGQTFTRRLGVISEASIISSIVNSFPKSGVAESIPQSRFRAKLILQHRPPLRNLRNQRIHSFKTAARGNSSRRPSFETLTSRARLFDSPALPARIETLDSRQR